MFSKLIKSLRWVILAGMLYTLYTVMLKDDVEFNNQTDEKVLVELAEKSDKSRDKFIINKRLVELYPDNKEHQTSYLASVKEQANKLIDAHEKMLLPMPLGNYRYVKNIRFGEDKNGEFVLVLNLTTIFNEKLDKATQKTLKNMFLITHNGIYTHYGFDKGMKLLLVPTFDNLETIKIMDLNRTAVEFPELNGDTTPDIPHHN